jgi:molybdopterin-guanine dinucleotide biosynthesis protein A
MGGIDKGLVTWNEKPLVHAVLNRLQSQTITPHSFWISANRNLQTYFHLVDHNCKVMTDERPDFAGPLAGIESVLHQIKEPLLLVVPCDTPLLPTNLFEFLYQAMREDSSLNAAYAWTSGDPSKRTETSTQTDSKTRVNRPGADQSSLNNSSNKGQPHPLCCLLRQSLATDLTACLDQGQQRVMGWMQRIHAKAVTFDDITAFANVNDPQTLAALRSAP